jgi:signal-transduction protein with cAMP-binding, CBS, and nucleotidyltransferase domain
MLDRHNLQSHEIFKHFKSRQVDKLFDSSEVIKFKAGEQVYKKDSKATHLYIVLKGQVTLRLPGTEKFSVVIDELAEGSIFGSCICFDIAHYALDAYCVEDSELLKIDSITLKQLMDEDLLMGYTVQTMISRIYFQRYIDTMTKLQNIVMNIPIKSD